MASWFYKLRRLLLTGNASDTFAVKTDAGTTLLSADTRNQLTTAKGLSVDGLTASDVTVTGLTTLGTGVPDPDFPSTTAALVATDHIVVTGSGKKVKAPGFEHVGGGSTSIIFYAKKNESDEGLTKFWLTFSGQMFTSVVETPPET